MKSARFIILTIFFSASMTTSIAQYYFKDIIVNRQTSAEMKEYQNAKIREIKIKSFDDKGVPGRQFFCEKKISKDYRKTTLYSKTGMTGKSLMTTTYNENLQVVSTYDSSDIAVNLSKFSYDEHNRLIKVSSVSKSSDDDYVNLITEDHIFKYETDKKAPSSMLKVKNNIDTTLILFSSDENGDITVEKDTKTAAKYYYYYDNTKNLTDIVHANEYSDKLISDYIFEYDETGRIDRQTAVDEGSRDYLTWIYEYNGNLRQKEKVYTKKGAFVGSITYEYK